LSSDITSVTDEVKQPERFAAIVGKLQKQPAALVETIQWDTDAASAEVFHVQPRPGARRSCWARWLIGSSRVISCC